MVLKYPVSDFYKDNILDGVTVNRTSLWWTAILAIKDPRSEKTFMNIYKWKLKEGDWKVVQSFKINSYKDASTIASELEKMSTHFGA